MLVSIYTLMDCKWVAGIMTEREQSTSYARSMFSVWTERRLPKIVLK